MSLDDRRRCCRGWIRYLASRTTTIWSVLFVLAYIKIEPVYSIDVSNRIGHETGRVQKQVKEIKTSNIFIRKPNDFIKDDAGTSTSLPIYTEQEAIITSSRIGNSKVGMKFGGIKCKKQKGKMKAKEKYIVDDDGNNNEDTICSPNPSTISPSISSSMTITPTVTTTTATPFPITTTSAPAPSINGKGKNKSKSKASPVSLELLELISDLLYSYSYFYPSHILKVQVQTWS